jgi:hypothetical protein
LIWEKDSAESSVIKQIAALASDGYTKRDAAKELSLSRFQLGRLLESEAAKALNIAFVEGRGGRRWSAQLHKK